jgi:predicted SAM-dependent methyltransferase
MTKLTVSPAVIVRFKPDGLRLHAATHPARILSAGRTDVLHVLSLFAVAREPAEVAERFPPEARAGLHAAIRQLVDAGLLVGTDEALDSKRPPKEPLQQAQEVLSALANASYSLAGDLNGFGPAIFERLAADRDPLSRLSSILAAIDELASELRAQRDDWLTAQLRALGVARQDRHLKLHIGSGGQTLDGWVDIDVAPAPLAMNLKWGLPFGAGAADYVFLCHVLEHFFYPAEALALLTDVHRVLAAGGVLRIVVPDIEKCLRAYAENDEVFFKNRQQTWDWWPEAETRLEDFLAYAGAGPSPGRLFAAHKFGYDLETLSHLLKRAGFQRIARSGYMDSAHAALRIDDASRVAGARFGDQYYSLFVEAAK